MLDVSGLINYNICMSNQRLINDIDDTIAARQPPMDDYDAGVIEGLRLARARIISYNKEVGWNDMFGDTEYTEFRVK